MTDQTARIALISAFEPEIEIPRSRIQDAQTVRHAKTDFVLGTLAGHPVVVFSSGVSMVNAAMTTQLALDHFNIGGIVVSGVAGGADPELSIGDIAVPVRWGQYMEMAFARETDNGYELPPFLSSDFANFGMMHTINLGVFEELAGHGNSRFWFPANEAFLDAAKAAASKLTLSTAAPDGQHLAHVPQIHVGGGGVSGTAFVDNAQFREWAHTTFNARVMDMETAAIAQVADVHDVPFLAFRALSDLAGAESGSNQFEIFMSLAGGNLADMVEAFLKELD
ncbi:5'-methylthioadenosine/S-adenosylhomocysteine nucleosidase [Ruegeria sp. R14_0]|uniref:5'-methylthioadenosine/S-adenosylhomocysteine nucleosidase n=1 Tax=Ruegeria sp. R14_0 TaxID=2821100 RepID=UPI001ADC5457|nr:5'-methylthioadenosine/S-adenosylhomocysteine nucleosidase [Ruegeria sp. R14_0]MBO9444552.1 5'-methylthioadenosine/S-adenosylhomocysteine nucleosidase [Ruegeria sp. R14_0]